MGNNMKYQLIVQQSCLTTKDFDRLVDIECELEEILGDSADVDGHDFGSGEANIFIFTDHPEETFKAIRTYLDASGILSIMRIAYRDMASDDFNVLWPENLVEFKVI